MSRDALTELNHYRLFGKSGLRVSPLCLGTMTFGTEWGWGTEKADCERIFDAFLDRGGNFIDTANFYTGGTSEEFLGAFMEGKREQTVLATKFTLSMREGDPNASGNHRKNIVQAVEASLRRLNTDYIDLYWLHAWDYTTPIEEVMRALDDLVSSGKVLYLGISDAPAWKVSQANTLAELRGWTSFVGLQIEYSLIERTVERELMPMAEELNIAVTPWSPLCGGLLTGKHKRGATAESADGKPSRDMEKKMTDENMKIVDAVVSVAEDVGFTPAQVSLNWLMQQPGVTSPIIGARTPEQLEDNLACLDFTLGGEHLERLNSVSEIDLGFPRKFLSSPFVQNIMTGGTVLER